MDISCMLPEADEIYQGTSQINLGTGPGRPWCRYATDNLQMTAYPEIILHM